MAGTRARRIRPALPAVLAVALGAIALHGCDARPGGDGRGTPARAGAGPDRPASVAGAEAHSRAARELARRACAAQRPAPGQPGKDVIWLPTSHALVRRMLRLADVGPGDYVVDLGAGDGRVPIAAARDFGARARGVEYEADVVAHARCLVAAEGLTARVSIDHGDAFEADFSDATVVTLYLLPELNLRLRPRLLALPPGTRIVSHRFDMGEWRPDAREVTRDGAALLWIVPAHVAGPWIVRRAADSAPAFELVIEQRYQQLSGIARLGDTVRPLRALRLRGAQLEFALTDRDGRTLEFAGTVAGRRLELHRTRAPRGGAQRFVGTRD